MSNEIALIPKNEISIAFANTGGVDVLFDRLATEARSHVPDLTTKKGRDAIASIAYKVSKSKTLVDDFGKDLVAEEKKRLALIDADRKSWRDRCDALRDEVRQPLTDWENAEKERVEGLNSRLESFKRLAAAYGLTTADEMRHSLDVLKSAVIGDDWQEFKAQAIVAKDEAITSLTKILNERQKYEDEQSELARLRQQEAEREQKEREQRIAEEAATKARAEAEVKAKAERDEQARIEAENIAKAEQAKRDAEEKQRAAEREQARLTAEAEAAKLREEAAIRQAEIDKQAALAKAKADQEAAIEAERQRVENERLQAEEAERKRLANVEHVRSINQSLVKSFATHGISEDQAKSLIKAIAKGEIKHISIQY